MSKNNSVNSDTQRKCKNCKSNVVNGRICLKCLSIYHNSCATKTKSCCDEIIQEEFTYVFKTNNEVNDVALTEEDYLKEENKLLKQIIKDKDIIIKDKEDIITLLNEKIISIEKLQSIKQSVVPEQCVDVIKSTEPKYSPKNGRQTQNPNSSKVNMLQPKQKVAQKADKHGEVPKKQRNKAITTSEVSLGVMEAQTMLKYNEIISLASNQACDESKVDDKNEAIKEQIKDGNWESQRRNRYNKRNIGKLDATDEKFKGDKQRIWLYLYKVSQQVHKEDIIEFLRRKTNDNGEEFIVKDLNENKRLKTFMVAGDLKFKDIFYSPTFWPKGVNYRRFDFNRHYEKYKTRNVLEDQSDNRPTSFLDGSHKKQKKQ